jgi:hypothetical protein
VAIVGPRLERALGPLVRPWSERAITAIVASRLEGTITAVLRARVERTVGAIIRARSDRAITTVLCPRAKRPIPSRLEGTVGLPLRPQRTVTSGLERPISRRLWPVGTISPTLSILRLRPERPISRRSGRPFAFGSRRALRRRRRVVLIPLVALRRLVVPIHPLDETRTLHGARHFEFGAWIFVLASRPPAGATTFDALTETLGAKRFGRFLR